MSAFTSSISRLSSAASVANIHDRAGRIIFIGSSTGGVQAISSLFDELPNTLPGIVIVQHMPKQFTGPFAEQLNQRSAIEVREAKDGDLVQPGTAFIAPGDEHMVIRKDPAGYRLVVKDGPLVTGHRPSVNVLFRSVSRYAGMRATGVILTGMGADGAAGMLLMKEAGAHTIAQNEDTCVVFGMPKEAIALKCVDTVLPIQHIAAKLVQLHPQSQTRSFSARLTK